MPNALMGQVAGAGRAPPPTGGGPQTSNPIMAQMRGGGGPAPGGPPSPMPGPQGVPGGAPGGPPQPPQITPEMAADMRLKMQVTGQAIRALLSDPNAGPKQAIQLIGGIIAENPTHFDANWGASILSDMPVDPAKFRPWLMQHAQMQAQAHARLDRIHPPAPQGQPGMPPGGPAGVPGAPQGAPPPQAPQIDPAVLQAAVAHRAGLENMVGNKGLKPEHVAQHLGVEPYHLPQDKDALHDLVAAHYVHAIGREHEIANAMRGAS